MQELFIILGILTIIILMTYATKELKKNGKVTNEDIQLVLSLFDITMDIVDEMNLKNETEIKLIAQIIDRSLNYALFISESDDIYDVAVKYAIDTLTNMNIEVTENRKDIISKLIQIGLVKY